MFLYPCRVIRYEDLSFNIQNMTRELFDFFRLSYVKPVEKFLSSHTKTKIGDVSSTFRNSKQAPIHWKTDLTFKQVILRFSNVFFYVSIGFN